MTRGGGFGDTSPPTPLPPPTQRDTSWLIQACPVVLCLLKKIEKISHDTLKSFSSKTDKYGG